MPYHDIQQIHSAGPHTVGGRVKAWAQSSLTESYRGIRDKEGLFRGIVEPPALIPGVNMGSAMPRKGKNSKEQQGAGDCCQTDRQEFDGLTPLAGFSEPQLYTGFTRN